GTGLRALGGGVKAAWKRPRADRVRAIRDRLRDAYGIPGQQPHGRPLDELVLTVLSQSTNDRNRDIAFARLRDRFGSWQEARAARAPSACCCGCAPTAAPPCAPVRAAAAAPAPPVGAAAPARAAGAAAG